MSAMTSEPAFRRQFQPRPEGAQRPNRFDANCANCGRYVKANEGYLFGEPGSWSVRHPDCEEIQAEKQSYGVPDGFYTVIHPDGEYQTFRVRTQDEDNDFLPGVQILGYLSGSDNETNYTNFGHLNEYDGNLTVRLWKRFSYREDLLDDAAVIINDPSAPREAYAEKSGRCSRCNRTLTVPSSLHAGLGPECAKKI